MAVVTLGGGGQQETMEVTRERWWELEGSFLVKGVIGII